MNSDFFVLYYRKAGTGSGESKVKRESPVAVKAIFFLVILMGVLCSFSLPFSWANAPDSVNLSYDDQKKSLHIEVLHVAHDPREHHIRKVEVSLNGGEPTNLYYATQTTPAKLLIDVPLEAKEGDQIKVLAICNEAGRKEETLLVPSPEENASSQSASTMAPAKPEPVKKQAPKKSSAY